MATGALDANGVWIYGEDDSESTFSALLNKHASSISATMKGRIAQIVSNYTITSVSNSTTTYVSTGLSVSITPKFSNSKIIVFVSQQGLSKSPGTTQNSLSIRLLRDSTVIQDFGKILLYTNTAMEQYGSTSTIFVENSGSTTSRSYSTQFANYVNSASVSVQSFGSPRSEIIVMEITA